MRESPKETKKILLYKAATPEGLVIEDRFIGSIEALRKFARENKLLILEYSTITSSATKKYQVSRFLDDLQSIIFLLSSGIPINESIKTLISNSSNEERKDFWTQVLVSLKEGHLFSKSLQNALKNSNLKDLVPLVTFIEISEKNGNVVEGLKVFKDFLQEKESLKKEIMSKFSYPLFLVISSYYILLLLLAFVIPNFYSIFDEENSPLYLKTMFYLGQLIKEYIIIFLLVPGAAFLVTKSKEFQKILLNFPLLKEITNYVFLYTFFYTGYSGLKAGLKLDSILKFMKSTSFFSIKKKVIEKLLKELKEGKSLSKSISQIPDFPSEVVPVIKAAEESNNLQKAFEGLFKRYKKRMDEKISKALKFIEPITLIAIGLIVGLVVLSIISSILDMTDAISK